MTHKATWRPVSVRLLVPELDAALGVGGRPVDWLHSCYGSDYLIAGRRVQYEYYFTDSLEWFFDSRLPLSFWSQPDGWWFDCDTFKYTTVGANPCPRIPTTPVPFPADWEDPELTAGTDACVPPAGVFLADSHGNTLWWH